LTAINITLFGNENQSPVYGKAKHCSHELNSQNQQQTTPTLPTILTMTTIAFTKMHGLGNDFVVIDAINQTITLSPKQIRFLADRHFGIGFDQLLLVEASHPDSSADFKYRIFNADGSEVSQCGNGARCFAHFIRCQKLSLKDDLLVDTHAGQLLLSFSQNDLITVNMGLPKHEPSQIPLAISSPQSSRYSVTIDTIEWSFSAVSIGNPHAVIVIDDIETAPVNTLGKTLENHPIFPERANIGFMQIIKPNHIKLRVYERGSGETLACGSGACAAVICGIERDMLEKDVRVELPGGELKIHWRGRSTPVFMTGSATPVFNGTISL
jgi:diaminopimelate epimerase